MMYLASQSSNQLQNIFGGGYVVEQHIDDADRYFPPSDIDAVCGSPTESLFGEVMKSLRSALSLH